AHATNAYSGCTRGISCDAQDSKPYDVGFFLLGCSLSCWMTFSAGTDFSQWSSKYRLSKLLMKGSCTTSPYLNLPFSSLARRATVLASIIQNDSLSSTVGTICLAPFPIK